MEFPRIIPDQPSGEAIDIATWEYDEEFGIHPVGSKPKRMITAPNDIELPYIIPGHSYLFKSADGWREHQVWSEVIAYRLGKLIGLPIPPSFIAFNSGTGETGVLVEFFFGYPDEPSPARLIHGVDAISSIFQSGRNGKPHTVMSNARVTKIMLGQTFGMDWWISAYAFDALIANTDRHTENWGFLVRRSADGSTHYEIAPLYDNGTSLGFQFRQEHLAKRSTDGAIDQFNRGGKHQCGWHVRDDTPLEHFTLCKRLLDVYPSAAAVIERIIGFDLSQVDEIIRQCTTYNVPVAFTIERAAFVSKLLHSRRQLLISLLREHHGKVR